MRLRRSPNLRDQAAGLVASTEQAVASTERAVADVAGDVSASVKFAGDEVARAAAVVALCVQLLTAVALAAFALYALRQPPRSHRPGVR